MDLHAFDVVPASPARLRQLVEVACFAVFAYAVYLAASYMHGTWLVEPDGGGSATDFVNVWAAGRLALDGNPAAAYDWPTHKAMEVIAVGHPFDGYFGWHYPPPFLFAAAKLALLSYTTAFVVWTFGTFPAYLIAIRAIVGDRVGYLLAAAFPAVLCNFADGQNGFVSAALLGGALLLLIDRPVVAGILLGLLTYKPHLGLLIPVALAAGGHWRAILSAAATALVMVLASWFAFGTETWLAFVLNIGHTSRAFLSDGWADFGKLQTAFGLVRTVGGGEELAWVAQGILAAVVAVVVAVVWRSRIGYDLKAAALAAASLLATPYLYTYDLVVLAVPLAFMFRVSMKKGFLPNELPAIGAVCLLIAVFPFVKVPVGFAAVLVVAALVVGRVSGRTERRRCRETGCDQQSA